VKAGGATGRAAAFRKPFGGLPDALAGQELNAPGDEGGLMAASHRVEAPQEALAAKRVDAPAPMIDLAGVERTYRVGRIDFPALRGVDLRIAAGELVAIVGPSGSGKTTILNLVAGIDRPTSGSVMVDGLRIDALSEEALAAWRGAHVGIVFQFFQLLPTLTALENAVLPLDFARRGSRRERYERARLNLDVVGLGDKADHLPAELSGGEQQRVAIARALACDPKLVVGDEPTGNLDSVTAGEMLELFERLNDEGKTVVYVTHDRELSARAHRTISIRDGLVVGA
jgi:putative ABC transport system ATP-binding protein